MDGSVRHSGRRRWRTAAGSAGGSSRLARVVVTLVAGLAVSGEAWAADAKVTGKHSSRRAPVVRPGLSPDSTLKLGQAFGLAVGRVEKNPGCRALFTKLGTSGSDRLLAAIYQQAPPEVVARRCRGGAAAAINPGSALTWVCPAFSGLAVQRAAVTLIHEALHSAGLAERPQVAGALSSAEINDLVRDSCGL